MRCIFCGKKKADRMIVGESLVAMSCDRCGRLFMSAVTVGITALDWDPNTDVPPEIKKCVDWFFMSNVEKGHLDGKQLLMKGDVE